MPSELFEIIATNLRVKTRRGLVEEQKKLGLCCEFNTDSQKLTLFNIETLAWNTNNSLGKVRHVEHLDDLLDIVEFLLLADILGLSKHSGKLQCLANSRGFEM